MVTYTLEHFPIQSAFLCQDCDSIGNCAEQCPACASHALMSLSAVLNREAVQRSSPLIQMPSALQHREPEAHEIEQHIARVA
jgi:ferredoxin